MNEVDVERAGEYAAGYSEYLFRAKTEREAVQISVTMLERAGYAPYRLGDTVVPGGI